MKKEYKFELPQNREVAKTNVRIEDGKVFVNVEFKDKFSPKDGDILYYKSSDSYALFICKKVSKENTFGCYYAIQYFKDGTKCTNANSENYTHIIGCRFATRDEVEKFLTDLEDKFHKRWNAKKKCLEDIRWRARKGGAYYYIASYGCVATCYDCGEPIDDMNYIIGNYFRTEEEAQPYAEKFKQLFKS